MRTPTTGLTEGDVNTLTGPDTTPQGGSDPMGPPATVGMPTPAREGNNPNHSEQDTGGGVSTPPATPPVNTPSATEGDRDLDPADDPPQLTEGPTDPEPDEDETAPQDPAPTLRERISHAADRYGLDVIPPSLADKGLPPLDHSRSWAERGSQAPATGPARIAYRAWDHTSRIPRYGLAVAYHVLARPGRTAVAFVALALLLRVPGVQDAFTIAFALTDAITYYTGLQWALGLT